MKAADFSYESPSTLDAALRLLADPERDVMALAGGQSLMPMMNFRLARPDLLVDLNGIDGLAGITHRGGMLRIGAMTRYSALESSALVQQLAPLLGLALPYIAHDAIRNRGTIGGSVALADPAAEMPALLLALTAVILVQGPAGERRITADDFFIGMYETDLQAGELVTAVLIPDAAPGDRFGFYELARRHGDYAMVGVAVALTGSSLRIAYFSVADRALRACAAEAILSTDIGAVDAAVAALDQLEFDGDLNATGTTKRHLAGVVLRRALQGMTG